MICTQAVNKHSVEGMGRGVPCDFATSSAAHRLLTTFYNCNHRDAPGSPSCLGFPSNTGAEAALGYLGLGASGEGEISPRR